MLNIFDGNEYNEKITKNAQTRRKIVKIHRYYYYCGHKILFYSLQSEFTCVCDNLIVKKEPSLNKHQTKRNTT